MPIKIKGPCWEDCDDCESGPCDCVAPILSDDSTSGTKGDAFSYFITPDNTPTATVTFSSDTLPAGLSLNSATGEISGTPTVSFNGAVTIYAENCCDTASATLSLVIHSALCNFSRSGIDEGLDVTLDTTEELGSGGFITVSWDMATVVKDRLLISYSGGSLDTGCVIGTGSFINAGPIVSNFLRVQIFHDCEATGNITTWSVSITCGSPFP